MFLSCQVSDRNYMTNLQLFFKYANNIFTIFEIIKIIVMKIKLLKDHLDHTSGDTIEVTEQRGGYLLRVGVGAKTENKTEYKEPKGKKLQKPRKDGVTTVFTPEEHDSRIKHLNKDL